MGAEPVARVKGEVRIAKQAADELRSRNAAEPQLDVSS
jgi:hypothetical protein